MIINWYWLKRAADADRKQATARGRREMILHRHTECPQESNNPPLSVQEAKEIDMQIFCVIEGYYHNALYLVYSYSNGRVWAENISPPSALIADWEPENGDHWFKLHMWRGRMRARLLSPSRSSCNLNIKLSSSIFDVATVAVKRRIWDPLVLCYKMEIQVWTELPYIICGDTVEAFQWWEVRIWKNDH